MLQPIRKVKNRKIYSTQSFVNLQYTIMTNQKLILQHIISTH